MPPPRLRLPIWPVWLAGALCEAVCVPFGIEPPLFRRRVDFYRKSRAFDTRERGTSWATIRPSTSEPASGAPRSGIAHEACSDDTTAPLDLRKLNIVHICDHLGWAGSRMHGVKRLFAWMIPRFDRHRFNVSLISLRKRDLSDDTLEELGIDVTYLHRSKFDPATLPALLKELDRRSADVVHMHGYGATTFGRLAAARRRLPAVSARARQPDRHALVPESRGPGAGAGIPTSRWRCRNRRRSS